MFWLTEHFLSIQGEGRYAGVPSYFLRTGGCNLNCPGFGVSYEVDGQRRFGCDTWFAVDRAYSNQWQGVESATKLLRDLDREFNTIGYKPHIVITGGEPLIYASDPIFYNLILGLLERRVVITFETNATIEIDFENLPAYKEVTFALSVKLSNSGEVKSKRVKPLALKKIANYSKEYFLKFTLDKDMIDSGDALKEIQDIRAFLPEAEVFCMPVGESRNKIWHNDRAVFDFCIKNNFHYSDRLHIRIFDFFLGV